MAIDHLPETTGEFDEDLRLWRQQFVVHKTGTWRSQLQAIFMTPFHGLVLKRPFVHASRTAGGYAEVPYTEDGLFDQHKQECGPCSSAGLVRSLTENKRVDPAFMAQHIPPSFISGDTHPLAMEIGVENAGIRSEAYEISGLPPESQRHFFRQKFEKACPVIVLTHFEAGGMKLGRHYDLLLSYEPDKDTVSGYNSYYGKRKHFMKGSDADRPGNYIEPMETLLKRMRAAHVGYFLYRGYALTGTPHSKKTNSP